MSLASVPVDETPSPARRGCLFCGTALRHTFVDLGMSPLCESYVAKERLNHMEPFYPLHVYVCDQCFLVQLQEYVSPEEIFTEYAYFSSYADSWVEHMRRYADMISARLGLGAKSLVVEVASNDGYLLQHFVQEGDPGARHRARRQRGPGRRREGDPHPGQVLRREDGPRAGAPTDCRPT